MSRKVPFVDLTVQYDRYGKEMLSVVEKCFAGGDFILREDLDLFEKNIAEHLGMKYAVGLNSGQDALFLALKSLDIGEGDEVITVGFTCVATLASIALCGAKPILVDVRNDFNMDVNQIENAITTKTKAIMPVHLNGRVCDMDKIMAVAKVRDLLVVEDAAQAMNAKFNNQLAGTFGLINCFSLYPMKVLGGAGDGGFVTTNDEQLAKKIICYRDLGQDRETGDVIAYGYNSRLDNMQAAILNLKIKYLDEFIERRRKIAKMYFEGLSDIQELKLPPNINDDKSYFDVYQNYVIRAENRDELVAYLSENSVETLISWYLSKPLHYHKALELSHFKLPNTEQYARECISLPQNTEINDEQIQYVIDMVIKFYQ
jgi:dTDP-4-amino-4,6-dideoxygalactose transaminase